MANLYQMLETRAGRRPANLYKCRDVELPKGEDKPAEPKPRRRKKSVPEGDDGGEAA